MNNKTDTDLVSVILPTFNRADFIANSVKSLISQTYKNLEIIIVDDGSTDDTENIIKNFKDERIKYIKLNENHGANYARNTGLKIAQGQFITFVDSDDEFKDVKIEEELKILSQNESTGLIYSWFYRCHNEDVKEEYKLSLEPKFGGNIFNELLYKNVIGNPSPLIRKECFDKVGKFDENMQSCQDWEMWIRISKDYNIEYLDKPLMKTTIHVSQISSNIGYKIQGMEYIYKKYRSYFNNNKKLSLFFRKIGNFYSLNNERKKSIEYYIQSIKVDPFIIHNYIHLIVISLSITFHHKLLKRFSLTKIGNSYLYY